MMGQRVKGKRILIVDDDHDTCAAMSDVFSDLGYDVDVAFDGASALERFRKAPCDLTLLDFRMPGIDGLELFRRIKRHAPEAQAICVTAFAAEEMVAAAIEVGVRCVLSKPVDFRRLVPLVAQLLCRPATAARSADRLGPTDQE